MENILEPADVADIERKKIQETKIEDEKANEGEIISMPKSKNGSCVSEKDFKKIMKMAKDKAYMVPGSTGNLYIPIESLVSFLWKYVPEDEKKKINLKEVLGKWKK